MAIFKVVFLKNEVLACHELLVTPHGFDNLRYEHDKNGHLIFAMIPADSEREAYLKAIELTRWVNRREFRA
jgi:hypothetical protein